MITDDLKIAQEIFNLLDSGIVKEYDAFKYSVDLFESYMQETLLVTINEVESGNAETDFNGAILYALVRKLKESSMRRGDDWKSFTMTYVKGGEVKLKYKYE